MINLGLSKTNSQWCELRDDQLWGKNVSVVHSMGDSKTRDPWFWQIVAPRGLSKEKEKEWSIDSRFSPLTDHIIVMLTIWSFI